ncbi:MAG: DsbA family protein [Chloroflexi bacterium]|nr:DsbA family protein [Chloroflexota bacterium]
MPSSKREKGKQPPARQASARPQPAKPARRAARAQQAARLATGRRRTAKKRSMFPIYAGVGVVVALVLVALLIVFNRGNSGKSSTSGVSVTAQGLTKGPQDAPVTIMEYADFQCPACQNFTETVEKQLESQYISPGKVKLVYRPYSFIGPESNWSAEAAYCANDQGRFWDYHDKLYDSQAGENKGTFSKANLKRFAKELGLDTNAFDSCLDSGKYSKTVQDDKKEGDRKGVQYTPTLFVDGQKIVGVPNYSDLDKLIKSELSKLGQ